MPRGPLVRRGGKRRRMLRTSNEHSGGGMTRRQRRLPVGRRVVRGNRIRGNIAGLCGNDRFAVRAIVVAVAGIRSGHEAGRDAEH